MSKIVYIKCSRCGRWVNFDHFNQEGSNMYCCGVKTTALTYNEKFEPTTYFPNDIIMIPKFKL